jgi:hypothetical protein
MKPDAGHFLGVIAAQLMMNIAPSLGTTYEQSNATMIAVMLLALGEEMERAASRRVEENREMRRIFAEAGPVVGDAALRSELEEVAGGREASFTLSDLEHANSALRALLIKLHAHIEDLRSERARQIEAMIWRELVASTERRRFSMGPF